MVQFSDKTQIIVTVGKKKKNRLIRFELGTSD